MTKTANPGAYVAGVWQPGAGEAFESLCPATGAVSWSGAAADPDQVAQAVGAARAAFEDWSLRPQAERTACLEAYADALAVRKPALAEAIARDMGKVLWDAEGEAAAMVGKIALSIEAQTTRAGTDEAEMPFGARRLTHRPHGVMAVFGPFNFPGHLPNGHIVPALLAGNTCVFKPSEQAPAVAALMVEAFEAAGLPSGCLNVVHGGRATGQALLEARIDGVLFTGSARTGIVFHRHFAGRPEVILALEMGGNNPLIAWPPADVDAVADLVAHSAYLTTGQRCTCARRVILPEGRFGDQVVEALLDRAEGLRIGGWDEEAVFMGPLVSSGAAEAAVAFQSDLQSRGARALKPLTRHTRGHGFVTPGILDVTLAQDVPDEELFGPLVQIQRVPDLDTAIAQANATRYGLSAGFVGDDADLWSYAAPRLRAGILNWNRPTVGASGTAPFGGPGLSGNHRPGAYYAADYSAWPQASQIAPRAMRQTAPGFHG